MKKFVVLCLLLLSDSMLHSSCTLPTSGKRMWNIAQENVSLTDLIEQKVKSLDLAFSVDFAGTFTVLNSLYSLVSQLESSAEILDTQLDILLQNITRDLSITDDIEQDVLAISSQVELISYNMERVFSALDNLEQTVSIQLHVLNSGLEQLDNTMFSLIEMEIADNITIMSGLEIINQEVITINSILDNIALESQLEVSSSLLSLLEASYNTLNSNVDLLDAIIATGFAGTFTALQENLQAACTIESLIDAIPRTLYVDLSSTYSALQALQLTMNTVDSQVDTIQVQLSTIDSETDIIASKFHLIESELSSLESQTAFLADDTTAISLLDQDITLLTQDNSIIDLWLQNEWQSKTALIINTTEDVESVLETQNSVLETVANDLADDISKVSILETESATIISRLSVISSELNQAFNTTLTIESLLDAIETESLVDSLVSKSQLLASELAIIETELPSISSKLDVFNGLVLDLDSILLSAMDNLSLTEIVESNISHILVNQSEADILVSKLSVIEGQVTTISSKMTIIDSRLQADILLSQDLVADFQETWTILDSISNILISDQLNLQTISSKLGNLNLTLDLSSVYTAINGIISQKYTLDTKVDIYSSLVDALDNLVINDFSAVFTALNGITSGEQTINSQLDQLNTDVTIISDYWGIPIYNSTLGASGYVITQPGRYYLAENINYTGAVNNAITISSNDVILDLNQGTLNYAAAAANISGIVSGSNNIRIVNGFISNFTGNGVQIANSNNLLCADLNVLGVDGNSFDLSGASQVIFYDSEANLSGVLGCNLTGCSNLLMKGVNCKKSNSSGLQNFASTNVVVEDCINTNNRSHGIETGSCINVLHDGLLCSGNVIGMDTLAAFPNSGYIIRKSAILNNREGLEVSSDSGVIIFKNDVIGSFASSGSNTGGIRLGSVAATSNAFIGFNNVINSASINIVQSTAGPNTYLGNFAFNSTAVGDPNNTNYSLSGGSNITNKYQTISQKGSFGDYVTGWHNINMLP